MRHMPNQHLSASRRTDVHQTAFTLMELIVAVSILVIIILSVGVIFRGASGAVTTSQATMDVTSSIRATQQLIERDLQHIDKNGFLVIRCRLNDNRTTTI